MFSGSLVHILRYFRDFFNSRDIKRDRNTFRLQQGHILGDQGVLRFGKNPYEIILSKRIEFHPYGGNAPATQESNQPVWDI